MLMGVEEPLSLIHAPNESVDPTEIEHMALAEALFLSAFARGSGRVPRHEGPSAMRDSPPGDES